MPLKLFPKVVTGKKNELNAALQQLDFFPETLGTRLAEFPKLENLSELPLPAAFDPTCKQCGETLNEMAMHYRTERRPFATFQCSNGKCKVRLMLFDAPGTPLLVWSNSFRYAVRFSDMIDERIKERDHKREVRALREHREP